jgi:hypothetical protein
MIGLMYFELLNYLLLGHRNICVEDLPPWTQESKTEKASRRAVSRYI